MVGKRRIPDAFGHIDDSDDEDFGAKPSPRKRQKQRVSRPARSKPKRRAGHHGSDITDNDDDVSEDSDDLEEDRVTEDDDEEPVLYESGRPGRRVAAGRGKYQEPPSDVDEVSDVKPKSKARTVQRGGRRLTTLKDEDDDEEPVQSRFSEERHSLIVKLKMPRGFVTNTAPRLATRSRTSSKAIPLESSYGLRRSSRTSRDERGSEAGRGRSVSDEVMRRPSRASKRLGSTASPEMERLPAIQQEPEDLAELLVSDVKERDASGEPDEETEEPQPAEDNNTVPESVADADEEEDQAPQRRTRSAKAPKKTVFAAPAPKQSTRRTTRSQRFGETPTSDFDPDGEGEEVPADDDQMSATDASPTKDSQADQSSQGGRRSGRLASKRASRRVSLEEDELDADELAEEAAELRASRARGSRRRKRDSIAYDQPKLRERAKQVDYRVFRPEALLADDEDAPVIAAIGARSKRAGGAYRSLFSTHGPFGGTGGPTPMFGAPGAAGGADSDSSDDEARINKTLGGAMGMTPTAGAGVPNLFGQTTNSDAQQAGGPANFGKVKDRKALADADPLGVDQSVNFDGVGGMEGHINQLKEMVLLPLLYPELFQTLHITPPRGVLFHGPPGTGKTLLARALASSVSMQGKKVTFYMRKGADALSKWVGEAERQLRLLFEEARKNQPSIIFFDEIDGLAPVRSSKQEQIHASIVATLLALMDGMDGRGQVIVIGATNRPDSVDPALRRPGRFDREFYFPLPNELGRRAIIDIHTKGWEPPLAPAFKDSLASLTKGYGGADLRALCTEAALNAIQGTYPQIYQSEDKLVVDPTNIRVLAKDFMISVNKMIPSSERSAPSGAAPLESSVEPLLRNALKKITMLLDDVLPDRKKLTALEEAEYDDRDDTGGFEREMMQQTFDRARIFRPRLLVYGAQGMGQPYIGKAILHKFERLHVQSLDLSVLFSDTARSAEAAVVQLFNEARRHKPSVIYIPNVDIWYSTVSDSVIRLLTGLLRTLAPNEPVLLLGIMELDPSESKPNSDLVRDLFSFSSQSHVKLEGPTSDQRHDYFDTVRKWIEMRPTDFPDLDNRKKRKLPVLEKAPVPVVAKKVLSKQEIKAQKKNDRHTLNLLKIRLQAIMEQLKRTYKQFNRPPIDPDLFGYLFDEDDPTCLGTDLPEEQRLGHDRPYEKKQDDKGVDGIFEKETGRFFYNLELITIERRLVNGYYKRPRDFGADIKRLYKDALTLGDTTRITKADNMRTNVETDLVMLEKTEPGLIAECEKVNEREHERQREAEQYAREQAEKGQDVPLIVPNIPPHISSTTEGTLGPISLGKMPGRDPVPITKSHLSNGYDSGHQEQHGSPVHSTQNDYDMDISTTDVYRMEISESGNGTTHDQTQAMSTQPHAQSQVSFVTPMLPGSRVDDYHNSASTTTSGKKSTDKSNSTNGIGESRSVHPDLSTHNTTQHLTQGSDLPATQDMRFQSSPSDTWGSQPIVQNHAAIDFSHLPDRPTSSMPPPATHPAPLSAILNHPDSPPHRRPQFIPVDFNWIQDFHAQLAETTSGFSVEQLEQTNARLVDAVWKTRGEWNRNKVLKDVQEAFNAVVLDIQQMQRIAKSSQDKSIGDESHA